MKYWIEQEERLLRRNCNYRREKLQILHEFLCRDLDRDSQVSFAIEGSELVMALKMMVVATWIVEGNSLKCVPGGWSSDGAIVAQNIVHARSVSLRLVFKFVQFISKSPAAEEFYAQV